MIRLFAAIERYFHWRNDCLFKAPYFPVWCDTGKAVASNGAPARRTIDPNGAITWDAAHDARLPFADHVEMSGFFTSAIVSYGATKNGALRLHRHTVFPNLRTIPNDTRGSLSHNFLTRAQARLRVDNQAVTRERLLSATLDGTLILTSDTGLGVEITRTLFPAAHQRALLEKIELRATDGKTHSILIQPSGYLQTTPAFRGVDGAYQLVSILSDASGRIDLTRQAAQAFELGAGERVTRYNAYCAARAGESVAFSATEEEAQRRAFLTRMRTSLRLETPEPVLNAALEFAKIRACESIFQTKNGLMHSPGGGSFYAALWTNDQCEYTSPLFPFIGYPAGLQEAENCFRLYMERMDPAMIRPLVSSIVAEGEAYWNGAGDRGDGAMFAYGAARYALASGEMSVAERLWDGVVWGIEYSLRQKNADGVIESDSDELENRFPSGDANLFTSCLVYDALISAIYLAKELDKPDFETRYRAEAEQLSAAIERFFGAPVEGYDTYRYYAGNDVLRAWICVPLTVGVFDRAAGTLSALWSDRLWTEDGLRTQAGCDTFWDRATLFALRGAFAAGDKTRALERLLHYARRRLTGEHAPYAVEAWPEGNQKHLSAESALLARVFTEGLFGIRPSGLKRFTLTPRLPRGWDRMALRDSFACGTRFDTEIFRVDAKIRVRVASGARVICDCAVCDGETITVDLTDCN